MAHRGKYKVKNISKYKGNHKNIVWRSTWEKLFMQYCDKNDNVLQWNSEEVIVPYKSPVDGRMHRYFLDFWMKVKTKEGIIKEYLIEVKPFKETQEPKTPTRKTKKFLTEVTKYCVNRAKWDHAIAYGKKRNMEFKIITEYDLNLAKK